MDLYVPKRNPACSCVCHTQFSVRQQDDGSIAFNPAIPGVSLRGITPDRPELGCSVCNCDGEAVAGNGAPVANRAQKRAKRDLPPGLKRVNDLVQQAEDAARVGDIEALGRLRREANQAALALDQRVHGEAAKQVIKRTARMVQPAAMVAGRNAALARINARRAALGLEPV